MCNDWGRAVTCLSDTKQLQPTAAPEGGGGGAMGARGGARGVKGAWGLAGVQRQFGEKVAGFQPFWEVSTHPPHPSIPFSLCRSSSSQPIQRTHPQKVMDDLDAHCRCLGDGQERRDRGSVSRRLVLPAPHASLVVKVDPGDPRGVSVGCAC